VAAVEVRAEPGQPGWHGNHGGRTKDDGWGGGTGYGGDGGEEVGMILGCSAIDVVRMV
jgi:hypothetical protein